MKIYFKNNILDEKELTIMSNNSALMYGYGVFETLKINNSKILFFKDHINRMKKSCDMLYLNIDTSEEEILYYSKQIIKVNKILNGSLKISCLKDIDNSNVLIQTGVKTYNNDLYKLGYKLCLSNTARNETSILSTIKSNNYLDNIIERQNALKNGYDEVVFLDTKGNISEGSISNIFWIKDKTLYTSSRECGIIEGICRKHVIKLAKKLGIVVIEGKYPVRELLNADEVFISNSLMDIMPVRSFLDTEYYIDTCILTKAISKAYEGILCAI